MFSFIYKCLFQTTWWTSNPHSIWGDKWLTIVEKYELQWLSCQIIVAGLLLIFHSGWKPITSWWSVNIYTQTAKFTKGHLLRPKIWVTDSKKSNPLKNSVTLPFKACTVFSQGPSAGRPTLYISIYYWVTFQQLVKQELIWRPATPSCTYHV